MKATYTSRKTLMREASEALIEKLGIAKASEFWASLNCGQSDYTKIRSKLFQGETVDSLFKKVKGVKK